VKRLNFFAVIFISVFGIALKANAKEVCITIDWTASSDSNTEGKQVPGGMPFAQYNGQPIIFTMEPGSEVLGGRKTLSSRSRGCFSSDLLVIGSSTFQMKYFISAPTNFVVVGVNTASFTLNKGLPQQKTLCTAVTRPGLNTGVSCQASISLSLREVDPDSANQIDQYKAEIESLKKDLIRMKGANLQDIKALETKLDELAAADLESLSSEQLLQVDAELASAAEMVDGFKKNIADLKAKYSKELNAEKVTIEGYRHQADEALVIEGVDLKSSEFYSQHDLASIDVESIDLAGLNDQAENFDENDNVYLDLENYTLEKLKRFEASQDWDGFNAVVSVWSNTVQFLSESLQARRETSLVTEFETLTRSTMRVKEWIGRRVDETGFDRNSTIPANVRKTIHDDISPENREKASELRNAIAKWQKGLLSPQQVLVLDTVEGIGAGYRALKTTDKDETVAVRAMLDRVLSQTIDVAKNVARIGIAFTPLNDFVDFCEVATGRSFCLPNGEKLTPVERGISAIGLVIGSGQFWREFGGVFFKNSAREGAEVASKLATELKTEARLQFSKVRKLMKLSTKQKTYLAKLVASDTVYTEERIRKILLRYGELEVNFAKVQSKTLSTTVSRGVKERFIKNVENVAEEVGSLNEFGLKESGRYSVGGKTLLGDNCLYTAIGDGKLAEKTVRAEMRDPTEKILIQKFDVKLQKVLDLSDESVLRELGVSSVDLISRIKSSNIAYDVTQAIGNLAQAHGFDAVIAPSAELMGSLNLVIFKSIR
jgi:hypothetical protein